MNTLTITDVPTEIYEQLKQNASRSHRTLNEELLARLEESLKVPLMAPKMFLQELETLQRRVSLPRLTDEFLRQAREEGRP